MVVENTKERKISMFEEIVTKDGLKFNDLEKKIYKNVIKDILILVPKNELINTI